MSRRRRELQEMSFIDGANAAAAAEDGDVAARLLALLERNLKVGSQPQNKKLVIEQTFLSTLHGMPSSEQQLKSFFIRIIHDHVCRIAGLSKLLPTGTRKR